MARADKSVANKSQGVTKVLRKMANTTVKQHTFLSSKIDWVTIYNASDVDIFYNFDDNDATLSNDYRTLKPGVESHPIGIVKDMTFEFKAVSGTNKRIELTLWG